MGLPRIFRCHIVIFLIFLIYINKRVSGIGCYVCSSKNGSDPNCEDPYHPALSTYAEDCKDGKDKHTGEFPANYCVKIVGTSDRNGESLMIRKCALENMDNQCGVFKFSGEQLTGCILTCDYDGCNVSARNLVALSLLPVLTAVHLIWC